MTKKLGFGLMRLPVTNADDPASIDAAELNRMVDAFLERGFTYFDTAYMYHNFRSETAIREALVKRHPRDRFTLTSKLPTMFLTAEEDMERIFEANALYGRIGSVARDDAAAMQYLFPGWKYDPKRPSIGRG